MNNHKYTLRKLGLLVVLATLAYSPFAVAAYRKATTKDPYILMARAIEAYEVPGVDVVRVWELPGVENGLAVLTNIEPYPEWTENQRENFKRHTLGVARDNDYSALEIAIGWDYPSKSMRVQGVFICTDLRVTSCIYRSIPGALVGPEHLKWPGIGNP